MDSLLDKLGIDWKLLLAQMINFLILLAILYKFLYKPVLKTLHDRQEKIDNSLKKAEDIEKQAFESEAEKAKIIQEARAEAGKIIADSKTMSEKLKEDLVNKTKLETASVIEQGKVALKNEKEQMFKELRGEVADMVTHATEKILKQKMDGDLDKQTIEKNLEDLR